MGYYVENHLANDEKIIVKAEKNKLALIGIWLKPIIWIIILAVVISLISGILSPDKESDNEDENYYSSITDSITDNEELDMIRKSVTTYVMLILGIPTVISLWKAIMYTLSFIKQETAITNRRIVGKTGFLNTRTVDASLEHAESCSVEQTLFGKIFNYSTFVAILGSTNYIKVNYLKNAESFKVEVNNQLEELNRKRAQEQAEMQAKQFAMAMAAANAAKEATVSEQ